MDNLYKFYVGGTKDTVKAYMLGHLDAIALQDMYQGKSVEGIKRAKEVIEDAFIELDKKFERKEEVNITSSR